MIPKDANKQNFPYSLYSDAWDYAVDAWQRSILFTDILRKRGNLYFEHEKAGHPPVLVFDYEMIVDGRELPQAVNYAIVKILDRERAAENRQNRTSAKRTSVPRKGDSPRSHKRPIVVIDPRAGHGLWKKSRRRSSFRNSFNAFIGSYKVKTGWQI